MSWQTPWVHRDLLLTQDTGRRVNVIREQRCTVAHQVLYPARETGLFLPKKPEFRRGRVCSSVRTWIQLWLRIWVICVRSAAIRACNVLSSGLSHRLQIRLSLWA